MTDALAYVPTSTVEGFSFMFQGEANGLSLMFGGPLYLVGSALHTSEPGDLDVRLILTADDVVAMFGPDAQNRHVEWKRSHLMMAREELKQSRRLTRRWRHAWHHDVARPMRFDFQFQVGDHAPSKPKHRLDKVPDEMFNAGRGDAT